MSNSIALEVTVSPASSLDFLLIFPAIRPPLNGHLLKMAVMRYSLDNFEVLKEVGKGAFGKIS